MKHYLVIDLEMCMVKGSAKKKMKGEKQEIIQIGAVMMDQKHRIIDEFSSFVKPEYGKVDEFIENLTGITQDDVEQASILRSALMKFADWIGRKVYSFTISFDMNTWEAERSILHCYVAVQFRTLNKRTIIEIDVNKRDFTA